MSSTQPNRSPSQPFDDVLAKMMQAEVNEGGPPPATPCDTPAEVISHIHMTDPEQPTEDRVRMAKKDCEKNLTAHLDRLRQEIREIRTKAATLKDAAQAKWRETIIALEAKDKAAHITLDAMTKSTGKVWDHLRDRAKHAWEDLEEAVRKAHAEL